MTANINKDTGIAFGIISSHAIHGDMIDTLLYSSHSRDLSFDECLKEHLTVKRREFDAAAEELSIKRAETGEDRENPNIGEDDPEFDEAFETEAFSESYQQEEPAIAGEYEGVSYQTTWLGGAMMLYIFKSPILTKCAVCSPCVPNAGDLDNVGAYLAYGVPTGWLDDAFIERQISFAGFVVVTNPYEKDGEFIYASHNYQQLSKKTWTTYNEAAVACYENHLQVEVPLVDTDTEGTCGLGIADAERKAGKNVNFCAKYGDPNWTKDKK